jgi:hypothetical protein
MIHEGQLREWAQAPSKDNDTLGDQVDIFLQGSYANSTNIQRDSDIDIVVCHKNYHFSGIDSLPDQEKIFYKLNQNSAGGYNFFEFKNHILRILQDCGLKVEKKSKCIKIPKINETYLNADVVPCFIHKRYQTHNAVSAEGIDFVTEKITKEDEDAKHIISFPAQHLENGERKNKSTDSKYKDIVRILKNCKKHLVENGHMDDKIASSFMIECLVWNVGNDYFKADSYTSMTKNILAKIWSDMQDEKKYKLYAEINDLFYLFGGNRNKNTPEEIGGFCNITYSLINN